MTNDNRFDNHNGFGDHDRDRQLGAALRALAEPPTADGFWHELAHRLAEVDGVDPADRSEHRTDAAASVGDPGWWRSQRGRVLLAAAVVLLGLGAATLLTNPFADDMTSVDAVDRSELEDSSESDRTGDNRDNGDGTADNTGNSATDNSATDGSDDGSETVDGTATIGSAVDYAGGPTTVVDAPPGSLLVGASTDNDLFLLTVPVPGSDGTGCEGMGTTALTAVTADGNPLPVDPAATGFNVVLQGPDGRFALGESCEEFVATTAIGSIAADGGLAIDHQLADAYSEFTDLAFLSTPVWGYNGSELYINGYTVGGGEIVVAYDSFTGTIDWSEPVPGPLVAEPAEQVRITRSSNGVEVNSAEVQGLEVPLARAEDGYLFIGTARSYDGRRHAFWNDTNLVVIDDTGSVEFQTTLNGAIADAAWTPSGALLAVSSTTSDLLLIDGDAAETSVDRIPIGEDDVDGWSLIEVADHGRSVAVSGFGGSELTTTRLLRFSGNPGNAVASDPSELSHYELMLRGMGPVEIGMTVAAASEALGREIVVNVDDDISLECHYATVPDDPNSPWLMVITEPGADPTTGIIARIELRPGHQTGSGISIGSSIDDVTAAYVERIAVSPNAYTGEDVLTYVPDDDFDAGYRMIFETMDGTVNAVRSGRLPEVEYIEGCL